MSKPFTSCLTRLRLISPNLKFILLEISLNLCPALMESLNQLAFMDLRTSKVSCICPGFFDEFPVF